MSQITNRRIGLPARLPDIGGLARIRWRIGRLELVFLGLVVLALGLRLWELDGRVMHYDEAIHLHYSWRLANLEPFIHSPWMHGPFQIELTALVMRILGDTDFTARLAYVILDLPWWDCPTSCGTTWAGPAQFLPR